MTQTARQSDPWHKQLLTLHARIRHLLERRIWKQHVGYWLTALIILAVTIPATPWLERHLGLDRVRDSIFQLLGEHTPRTLAPRYVKVVMIGDDDYYHDNKGQSPLNRDYLAGIVRALDDANAAIIALDINETLDDPQTPVKPGDFARVDSRAATDDFMRAIAQAANKRNIVLAKLFLGDSYRLAADLFQVYGICVKPLADGAWYNPGAPGFPLSPEAKRNITCGYVALTVSKTQVTPQLDIPGENYPVDSFALSIARGWSPRDAQAVGKKALFASYIPPGAIRNAGVVIEAGRMLHHDAAAVRAVRFKPVIVGGNWHGDGYNMGDRKDMHRTPVGEMSGALIHENFTEAILDGRLAARTPEWILHALEILTGIVAMFLFAAYSHLWAKILLFCGAVVVLLLVQWAMLNLTGAYFEAFFPLLGLAVHSVLDRFFSS